MTLKEIIKKIMTTNPYTVNNVPLLVEEVTRFYYRVKYKNDARNIPYGRIMHLMCIGELPNYESIAREARRIRKEL